MTFRSTHIALDLETSGVDDRYGLQPWRVKSNEAWIKAMSVAYYDEHGKMQVIGVLDPSADDFVEMFDGFKDKRIICWNTPFDISWLLAYGMEKEVWATPWLDAMLLWQHRDREPEYDKKGEQRRKWRLEDAVVQHYPQHAGFKGITDFHTTDPVLLQRLLIRNKMDAATTLRLAEKFWDTLSPEQRNCAVIEAASLPMVARANLHGLFADPEHLDHISVELEQKAAACLHELSKFGATPKILASPTQLAKLLYDDWQLPVLSLTDSGNRSTSKEVLFELAPSDARANLVKEYREAVNNRTKFVANIADSLAYNGDGYTRPAARVYGTYSGRMTYSSSQGKGKQQVQTGFALHQMKRGEEFRSAILPPPGYKLVEFDAANQEFRLMALLSGDPKMLELCLPGQDPHGYMGSQIGRVGYDWIREAIHLKDEDGKKAKQYRKVGKFANLSFQYRVGVNTATVTARVNHGLDVDVPFVAKVKGVYLRSYSMVERYWEKSVRKARRLGYAETLGGRRVQLKGNWNGSQAWSMESTAINLPIQGTGADQKYLALACLKPVLTKYGGYFFYELHDGVFFVFPEHNTMSAIAECKATLNNLPYQKAWGYVPTIPLPWDCKVGDSWGTMEEV
jgi:DNA polymerase I-like protein with 3'-5' exonuclease and polymerase domains